LNLRNFDNECIVEFIDLSVINLVISSLSYGFNS